MRLPPDLVYDLSPPLLFLLVLASVGAVALLIQALIRLPFIAKAAPQLAQITPAVSTIACAIFGLSM